MATYSFKAARQCVLETVRRHVAPPAVEEVDLLEAAGRVLAEDILADRDYPPAARSIRDGYAVRAADVPGELTVLGEVRAGESFTGEIGPGQAMEIMTGAALPPGADAIVMVEFTTRNGDRMTTNHQAAPGEFVNPQGSEARKSDVVIPQGRRLGFADIAMIATVGRPRVQVYLPPRVAILATGDELVEIEEEPASSQVRNSNSRSLAVQVRRAGGLPHILPVARDNLESTRERIAEGLLYDLLLLSGGVSAGKYDLV